MKLFYQLSEEEQHKALHHCANMVIEDILESGIKLDFTEEDQDIKDILETAVYDALKFVDREDQIQYLLEIEPVSKLIFDLALDLAKSAFYHSDEEVVIYASMLKDEETSDNDIDSMKEPDVDSDEENLVIRTKKNNFSIN